MTERHANLMGELTTIALATDGSSCSYIFCTFK